MRRTLLLALLALAAVPATAPAAPAKISPKAVTVSAGGIATVEVANPNRYVLRGKAKVVVKRRTIASKAVRLPKRSVTEVKIRLSAKAQAALKAAGERATISMALRRPGSSKKVTARRTLKMTPAAPAPAPAPGPAADPGPAPAPAPSSGRFLGRMGAEGGYDDFELTVSGGQLQFTKPPTVPVMCFENGGSYRSALSFEIFDAPGPWTIGTDGEVRKEGISVNQLVSSGARGITYKVTGTSQDASRVAGTLGMSFFESKYDVFTNTITFINCSGSQSFEAIPG